jgi:Rieske Fe-S protein
MSNPVRPACDSVRRAICAAAGAGLVSIVLPGCDGGVTRIDNGQIDDPPPGAPPQESPDMAKPSTGGTTGTNGGTTGGTTGTNGGTTGGTTGTNGGTTGGTTGTNGGTTGTTGGTTGGVQCSGQVNAGLASAIAVGGAKRFLSGGNDVWVCHDSKGYYALANYCTHAGCSVSLQSNQSFYCRCHGATFAFDGGQPTSPAYQPLDHLALCIDSTGTIVVDANTVVSSSTRA